MGDQLSHPKRAIHNKHYMEFIFIHAVFASDRILFAAGTVSGYFAALVRDQPALSYETMKHDIDNYSESSITYLPEKSRLGK
ncbi:hypothetical protein NBRC111894_3107 [Sporolactobacillus inulinus]|uniref:Uncharacterized protein n=1 Tax=Sporolactobacillus inulinus TaxID=2078 RepID=A0A4Y1ZEX8_9BACL|nr:hypothetical protein [Sporolactobacillus inulinus]GAY77553.1 hypothetical protein NBRC111894_3107 [Sporolactobacillus inulinus]